MRQVLCEYCQKGYLTWKQAEHVVKDIFFNNSNKLYRLGLKLEELPYDAPQPPRRDVTNRELLSKFLLESAPPPGSSSSGGNNNASASSFLRVNWTDFTAMPRTRVMPHAPGSDAPRRRRCALDRHHESQPRPAAKRPGGAGHLARRRVPPPPGFFLPPRGARPRPRQRVGRVPRGRRLRLPPVPAQPPHARAGGGGGRAGPHLPGRLRDRATPPGAARRRRDGPADLPPARDRRPRLVRGRRHGRRPGHARRRARRARPRRARHPRRAVPPRERARPVRGRAAARAAARGRRDAAARAGRARCRCPPAPGSA